MKKLFLCSYFAGVKDLFRQYASEKQLGKQVLFIPTAGNVEEYRGYIDEALQTFADLGFQVEVLDISACDADGMVYVGESAGAIITAKDIDYNKIMDDKEVAGELSDTVALHEADFYLLPHVGEEPFAESAQSTLDTYSDQLHLLPLNNHQAVLVEGEEVKVLVENK